MLLTSDGLQPFEPGMQTSFLEAGDGAMLLTSDGLAQPLVLGMQTSHLEAGDGAMTLMPEGLAQPLAPGLQTSFLGAGGPFVVPMKTGICASPSFEPIFSTACPLPQEELDFVVDRLNATSTKAAPSCCMFGPFLLIPVGFLIILASMMSVAESSFARFTVGMALCAVGGFGGKFASVVLMGRALSAIRRELSELNAQYNHRGIDFQLLCGHPALLIRALHPEQPGFAPSAPPLLPGSSPW